MSTTIKVDDRILVDACSIGFSSFHGVLTLEFVVELNSLWRFFFVFLLPVQTVGWRSKRTIKTPKFHSAHSGTERLSVFSICFIYLLILANRIIFLLDFFSVLQTFLSLVDDYIEDDLIIEYHIGHFSLQISDQFY